MIAEGSGKYPEVAQGAAVATVPRGSQL